MSQRTRGGPHAAVGDEHHVLGGQAQAVGARGRGRRERRRLVGAGVRAGVRVRARRGEGGRGAAAAAAAGGVPGQSQFELVRDLGRNVLEANAGAWKDD